MWRQGRSTKSSEWGGLEDRLTDSSQLVPSHVRKPAPRCETRARFAYATNDRLSRAAFWLNWRVVRPIPFRSSCIVNHQPAHRKLRMSAATGSRNLTEPSEKDRTPIVERKRSGVEPSPLSPALERRIRQQENRTIPADVVEPALPPFG